MNSMGLDPRKKDVFNTKNEDTYSIHMSLTMATLHQITTCPTLK